MKLMNLKQFQNVYTSEDNYSFSEIMYKNQLQHFSKYPWIYQQKIADNRQKYLSILSSVNLTFTQTIILKNTKKTTSSNLSHPNKTTSNQ